MMPLDKPVPIIFAVCQGVQAVQGGSFNILGVFDRLTIAPLPDGTGPEAVTIQVVTTWTGGSGDFNQVLQILDEDGKQLLRMPTPFSLPVTNHRHYIVSNIGMPAKAGVYTLIVGREDEEELLRQDFTIEVAQAAQTGL